MKKMFGNKGCNLMMMEQNSIRVPPFMLLTNEIVWKGEPADWAEAIDLEGSIDWTKMVSVRSSGAVSMPGLLHTELNVSLGGVLRAIAKVRDSWNTKEAKFYREVMDIDDDCAGGVVIQQMVNATKGGSGVVTVQTSNDVGIVSVQGEWTHGHYGDVLVGGTIKPEKWIDFPKELRWRLGMEISEIIKCTDTHQEIEFAYDGEHVWILQTRDYTPPPHFEGEHKMSVSHTGKCAYPGKIMGQVVRKGDEPANFSNPIFVAKHTMPEDVKMMFECMGIITEIGGTLSHAAILAQKFNKPTLVGTGLNIDRLFPTGQWIALDAANGSIAFYESGIDSYETKD